MVTMAMTAITYDGDGDAGQPLIRMVPLMMVIMVMMALMMVMRIVIVIMVVIMVLPITLLPALYNPMVHWYPIQCYNSALFELFNATEVLRTPTGDHSG